MQQEFGFYFKNEKNTNTQVCLHSYICIQFVEITLTEEVLKYLGSVDLIQLKNVQNVSIRKTFLVLP